MIIPIEPISGVNMEYFEKKPLYYKKMIREKKLEETIVKTDEYVPSVNVYSESSVINDNI
jgi:hypothetical protein